MNLEGTWDTTLIQLGDRAVPRYAIPNDKLPKVAAVEHYRVRPNGRVTDVVAVVLNERDCVIFDTASCSLADAYVRRVGLRLAFHRALGAVRQFYQKGGVPSNGTPHRWRGAIFTDLRGLEGVKMRDAVRKRLQSAGVPL